MFFKVQTAWFIIGTLIENELKNKMTEKKPDWTVFLRSDPRALGAKKNRV